MNLYGYVLGDPVNFVDPTGEFSLSSEALYQVGLNGPLDSLGGYFDAVDAWKATESLFPDTNQRTGKANAFRHCYWSCLMANRMGKETSLDIGAVHEVCGDNDMTDLLNNMSGANMFGGNCKQNCFDALYNGELSLD